MQSKGVEAVRRLFKMSVSIQSRDSPDSRKVGFSKKRNILVQLHFCLKNNFFENEILVQFNMNGDFSASIGTVSMGSGTAVIIVIIQVCFWIPVGTGKVKTLGLKLKSKKKKNKSV